jgi:hypothetical protein
VQGLVLWPTPYKYIQGLEITFGNLTNGSVAADVYQDTIILDECKQVNLIAAGTWKSTSCLSSMIT